MPWGGMEGEGLEYGIDNLVDNLVEVFLFDAAEAALNVALDVARTYRPRPPAKPSG